MPLQILEGTVVEIETGGEELQRHEQEGRAGDRAVEREWRNPVEHGPAGTGPMDHRRAYCGHDRGADGQEYERLAMEPGRCGAEQAGGRPPAFGRHDAFQHRHEIPARRPQHDGEPASQGQRHGERLADRRDLPVAQVRDPGRGGEQDGGLDTPVGLEDHRLGGRRGGRHRLGKPVLDQRPAPAFQQAGAKRRPLAALRPHRDVERAFELEARFQQIGDGAETIHPRLAPKHQRGECPPPKDAQAERAHHRTASATTVRLAAASCSVPAPLSSASNGSTAPSATSFQILPPIGAPPISWRQ